MSRNNDIAPPAAPPAPESKPAPPAPESKPAPPAPADSERPQLGWLRVADCHVDGRYQRDLSAKRSQALIEKIAAGFDWRRFGVVLATRWPERDGWSVIDGQHRIAAASRLGVEDVPGLVYPEMPVTEAAAIFTSLNRDRLAMTPLHVYRAMLAAGDADAVAVDKVCLGAGVTVAPYPKAAAQLAPGETMAVSALHRARRSCGDAALGRALSILVRAWPNEGGHLRSALIGGLACLLRYDRSGLDDGAMVRALGRYPGAHWCGLATSWRESSGGGSAERAMARVLLDAAGLRREALPEERRNARSLGRMLEEPVRRRCVGCKGIFMTQDLNELRCGACRPSTSSGQASIRPSTPRRRGNTQDERG